MPRNKRARKLLRKGRARDAREEQKLQWARLRKYKGKPEEGARDALPEGARPLQGS